MKLNFLILSLSLLPLTGMAQENHQTVSDTTIVVKGRKYVIKEADKKLNIQVYGKTQKGDSIKDDMIYEATYNDEQTTERRFQFSMPFAKQKRKYHFDAHGETIYWGLSQLNTGFGTWHGSVAELNNSKSWEIGINLVSADAAISKDGHWGASVSLGWVYTSYRLDGNYAFRKVDGVTVIQPGTDENYYKDARLRYNAFRMPLCLEWQQHGSSGLFVRGGVEAEYRYRIKSKGRIPTGKHTLDSDLYVNPLSMNLLLGVGYDEIGFYLRCSSMKLFKNNKGPVTYPCSFGIVWYI
jgi:hypothetical protein